METFDYRYLVDDIDEDLKEKMVFIGGPRQVGKTTLAILVAEKRYQNIQYLNWDDKKDKQIILKSRFDPDAEILIFDEVHKYTKWKSLIKGIFDKNKKKYKIIVTGSARLNVYRRGGDSLLGRYHYYNLHPFTLAELNKIKNEIEPFSALKFTHNKNEKEYNQNLEKLFINGGFPEPFLKNNSKTLRRWHSARKELLFKEDVREVTMVKDLTTMEILADLLPERAGGMLSINSLKEDLSVTHKVVVNWIEILESLYYAFRIFPYQGKKIKALKKEPKLYLWDWSEVSSEGAKFENLIASHLLKFVNYMHDALGFQTELFYIRDIEKREVDFLITEKGKPWFAVEVKLSQDKISKELKYFREKLSIPFCYQVVKNLEQEYENDGIRVMPAWKFVSALK